MPRLSGAGVSSWAPATSPPELVNADIDMRALNLEFSGTAPRPDNAGLPLGIPLSDLESFRLM